MSADQKTKVLWVSNTLGVGGSERQLLSMYHILQKYSSLDITVLYYARAEYELPLEGVQAVFIDKKNNDTYNKGE